jgi:beta-glucosidase
MKNPSTASRPGIASVLIVALVFGTALPVAAQETDLARSGSVTASSTQEDADGSFPAGNAIDGNPATRWARAKGPDADVEFSASITSVLAEPATISRIQLAWEAAYATSYEVQVAASAAVPTWRTVFVQADGDGGLDSIVLPAAESAAAVRVIMTKRAPVNWEPGTPHWYGYSLYSIEIFGSAASAPSPPAPGKTEILEDFGADAPADYVSWSSTTALTPALSTVVDESVPNSEPGNSVLVATVADGAAGSDYFGFTNDTTAEDWSDWDGFRFWFLASGSGRSLSFELKSDGLLFDHSVVDDVPGWREISVLFSDLRVKGDATSTARFSPAASTGFAVTLTGLGSGAYAFDAFSLFEHAITLDDFENDIAIGSAANPVGYFPWFSDTATVSLGTEVQGRGDITDNRVLTGSASIPAGGYGGFSDNLSTSQDWSSYGGIRFWWYASQSSNPASPTAGDQITVEIKDGGPDGEHAERWTAVFRDNWGSSTSRWKLVELPFSQFTLAQYQPGSGATLNGSLDLTQAWGFGLGLPPGKTSPVRFAIDDVQLYGTPAVLTEYSVSTDEDVYLVEQGGSASISVSVTTATGAPLATDVRVTYTTGPGGTGVIGRNYNDFAGDITFAAGAASGTSQTITVDTLAVAGGDQARSIPIALSAPGAELPAAHPRVVINAHDLPYLDPALPVAARVDDLLSRMSLEQKAGQMAQAERLGLESAQQIGELGLGSILSGGGSVPDGNTPGAWADMIDGFQLQALSTPLQIPLLYGVDAVHGHSNLLGATIFPHNLGLGATRNPELVRQIGEATAAETRATGVNWTFAPCLCITRDERWGRSYESFGEDPELVRSFAAAATIGLQGEDPTDKSDPDEVLATAKHWAGDGGTRYEPSLIGDGYPIDQGVTHSDSLESFSRLFIDPYVPAIDAGVGSIMPSYSGVDFGDGVIRMHEHTQLNTDVLKRDLGFAGFLISDWEGIDKLPGDDYADKVARSVNSGMDMGMAPYNFAAFISSVIAGVDAGTIAPSRVDDAVRRILTQKFQLGLFEQTLTDRSLQPNIGSPEHRALARQAVAQSQVLLKNEATLPLAKDGSLYVAGSNADDLGHQMGGWSISWQGGSGATTTGTTILQGIRDAAPGATVTYSKDASTSMSGYDTGIVVVGESPYAEGVGDVGNNGNSLELTPGDRAAIDRVCAAMRCVVLVVSGRPQIITEQLDQIDALVASFLPGSEGAGVADVLFGDEPFTGLLPISWPKSADQVPINVGDPEYDPLFAFGWGLQSGSAP